GDISHLSSGATNQIGAAGRLQLASSQQAVSTLTNGGKNNLYAGIIKLIPPVTALKVIGGILGILQNGILGVDQRPEFDMDGSGTYDQLYSVALYKGFQKANPSGDPLGKIASDLRSGNFSGAVKATVGLGNQLIHDASSIVSSVSNTIGSLFGQRNFPIAGVSIPTGLFPSPGNRYFITGLNDQDVDR